MFPRTTLRYWLVGLSVAALLLGIASTASAANLYWYGENNSTCWQTGFPGNPASKCDTVGAAYLPEGHVRAAALGGDIELVNSGASGDYCNYYNLGPKGGEEELDTTNENEQGRFTGFNPPTPYGSYQEGNHYDPPDVCQADGTTWGQVVRGNSANSNCEGSYAPCEIQHFVSLGAQEMRDQPWSSALGSPSLVVSAEADPDVVEAPNSWGYLCPLLRAPSGGTIEYCLEQWHVGSGSYPAYKGFDEVSLCYSGGGQVFTGFAHGTKFAELVSGSSETFEYKGNPAHRTFTARITLSDLEAAVTELEKYKCGTQSHSFREYALVGIEQGVEGGGVHGQENHPGLIGDTTAHLQAWSEYTPLQPEAVTEAATGITEASAVLNGKVNPRGTATQYYFQYGETPSYGSSTSPVGNAGSGDSLITTTPTPISGLKPGVTYHFRIVALGAGEPVYGKDREFKTLEQPDAFFADATAGGSMSSWTWSEPSHWQMRSFLRDQIAAKSSPSALVWGGVPNVFFSDKNDAGELSDWSWS